MIRAYILRAARNFAISSKRSLCEAKKNERRGANESTGSPAAIARARAGQYRERSFRTLPPALRDKYFDAGEGIWTVKPSLHRRITIIGATRIPELTAGVVFYGIPPEQAAKPADVKIPLQAHFANKDDWCTPALVDGFEKGMKAAGKSLELFRYDAEHAFVNEQRQSVHDREAAELAWGRATEFFKKHLG